MLWHGKPYYSLDAYCKDELHHKCYKIALDAQMTCPNRDGTLDTRGCIFCSAGGSGDFAVKTANRTVAEQLSEGAALLKGKRVGNHFIAYFQAYTNTYAPIAVLEPLYRQALAHPDVCGISIATRPDCLPEEVLALLTRLRAEFPEKFIWVELGLQTIREDIALFLRRGYTLSCFEDASARLARRGIPLIVHVILGLPGETPKDMLNTVRFLNLNPPFGIKLQLLHVLKGTDLAACYKTGQFQVMTKEEYLSVLIQCLELLSPKTVIHRLTGDGPGKLLIAPDWSRNKRDVLNSLHRLMRERNTFQGIRYTAPDDSAPPLC